MARVDKIIIVLSLLVHAAAQGGCNSTKYLEVTLWDSFGDGWDDALWMMRDPNGNTFTDAPTCWDREKMFDVQPCDHVPESSGLYYMTVNTPDESLSEGWWEIYWKVEVFFSNGTATGEYYEGVYNTTMVWEYNKDTDHWCLIHYDGIPDFECDGCSNSVCDDEKPKPKPKPKARPRKRGRRGKPLKGKGRGKSSAGNDECVDDEGHICNCTDTDGTGSGGSGDSGDTESSDEVEYGARNTVLEVKMYDEEDETGCCNGWSDINIIGAHWYISDCWKTCLFDDGTLCEGCAGTGTVCLGDGSYVFRVTGPTFNESNTDADPYTAWEFCHARGFFNDQLNFHIMNGQCYPDDLRSVDEICDAQENSTVVLVGTIALYGVTSEIFHTSDAGLLKSVIASTVEGWKASQIVITDTYIDSRSLSTDSRALSSFNHDVSFTVTFTAEDFGIDGATYAAVSALVSDMAATIQASFDSGSFASVLTERARVASAFILEDVRGGELISLDIKSIEYKHSDLIYIYLDDTQSTPASTVSSGNNFTKIIPLFIVIAVAIALAAVFGVATSKFKDYNKVTIESDSQSGFGFLSSNMDTSSNEDAMESQEEVNPFASTAELSPRMFESRRV